jgi:hypothetical protein
MLTVARDVVGMVPVEQGFPGVVAMGVSSILSLFLAAWMMGVGCTCLC